MMQVSKVKKLEELRITVEEGCSGVNGCFRKVVLTDLGGNEEFAVTLTGDDALVPLKEGQKVLVDLRWEHFRMFGENHDEYYVMSIRALGDDVKIEYVKDWTARLV